MLSIASEMNDRAPLERGSGERTGLDDLPVSPAVGCLASLLLSILGVLLIFQLARLLIEGEIRLGGGPLTPNRVWLVQEGANRGLGWSRGRVLHELSSEDRSCVETSVRYLLWQADETAQAVNFCDCYKHTGDRWQNDGLCPDGTQGGDP